MAATTKSTTKIITNATTNVALNITVTVKNTTEVVNLEEIKTVPLSDEYNALLSNQEENLLYNPNILNQTDMNYLVYNEEAPSEILNSMDVTMKPPPNLTNTGDYLREDSVTLSVLSSYTIKDKILIPSNNEAVNILKEESEEVGVTGVTYKEVVVENRQEEENFYPNPPSVVIPSIKKDQNQKVSFLHRN